MSCDCYRIGGPFIGADPDCEIHREGGIEDRLDSLTEELEETRKLLGRYRDALSDIQEHTAGEGGDGYAMQEIADAALSRKGR